MKKILFWIFSAAVALSGTLAAEAAQPAQKVSARPSQAEKTLKAEAKPDYRLAINQNRTLKQRTLNVLTNRKAANPARTVVREGASLPELCGNVLYRTSWAENQDAAKPGLYTVSAAGADNFLFATDGSYGGVVADGVYFTQDLLSFWGFYFYTAYGYDIETGEKVFEVNGEDFSIISLSETYDPTTGIIYGINYNAEGSGLILAKISYDVDAKSVNVEQIASLDGQWNSIACSPDGQLYAIQRVGESTDDGFNCTASNLVKIDKATGAVTVVGPTGFAPAYISDATFTHDGRLLWTISPSDDTGRLAEINLTTGAATQIAEFADGDEIAGLYAPVPPTPGAPNAPTNLSLLFENGSLDGTLTFTAPATDNQDKAEGALTYHVLYNGAEVATGDVNYGELVGVPVTAAEAGTVTFAVKVKNAVGESKLVKVSAFAGKGTPDAPEVTAAYADGTMKITWTAVTTSADGGYIDPAAITYSVRLKGSDTFLAEDLTVLEYSYAVAVPETPISYVYEVIAKYEAKTSAAGVSNAISLGTIVPPYSQDFTDNDALASFTIIDANNDGKVWTVYNGAARMSYNSSLEMDDWMITPGIKVEAGKLYIVEFDTYGQGRSFIESIEVKYGNAAAPAAMTNEILPKTILKDDQGNGIQAAAPLHVSYNLLPTEDGTIFIGFHGVSDADQYYLFVDNLSISGARSTTAPAAVSDLTVTAAEDASLKATVAFTAPAKTIGGAALESLTKIAISRDGEALAEVQAAPGATVSYVDEAVPAPGVHTYTVVAHNAEGAGLAAEASAFVGNGVPAAPENVAYTEPVNGTIKLTWDAVTTDVNGKSLGSAVTYSVYEYTGSGRTPVEGFTNISATEAQFVAVPEGEQALVEYLVFAENTTGESEGVSCGLAAIGTPVKNYDESFADATISYDLGITRGSSDVSVSLANDSSIQGITSADGDNGYLFVKGEYLDSTGGVITLKLDLAGTVNPGFSFYTYNIVSEDAGSPNEVNVEVAEAGSEEYTKVLTTTPATLGGATEGWFKASANLAAYAGKVVRIRLTAAVKQFKYTMFDALRVYSMVDYDLRHAGIEAPAKVQAGEDYTVDVKVVNDGGQKAVGHKVELYADGQLVDTKDCEELEASKAAVVSFTRNMHVLTEEPVVYTAKVVFDADMVPENNSSDASVAVAPKHLNVPVVTDLAGEKAEAGVKLTWSEPNLEGGAVETVTEGFEEFTEFSADGFNVASYEENGWIFIDEDNAKIGGFSGMDLPNLTPGATTGSFFTFDQSAGNQTFAAHSGEQYLAALFRYDDGQTSDWAISPALSGNAQTIELYARSYSAQYPEKIEFLYSTGGTGVDDFQLISTVESVPGEWTLYSIDVPAGAARFAIHSCAQGSFMLMIDDVTYERGSSTASLTIAGYNVYANGEKLNEAPVEECSYVHAGAVGNNEYQVTVVYAEKGESKGSNKVSVNAALNDVAAAKASVKVVAHNIVIANAEGLDITVSDVAGRVIYAAQGQALTTVPASQGVYMVKVNKAVTKVIVK